MTYRPAISAGLYMNESRKSLLEKKRYDSFRATSTCSYPSMISPTLTSL